MSRPPRAKTGPRQSGFSDAGLERLLQAARHTPAREHTYQEIAEAAGVTDARIQQIVQKALKKLRHPAVLSQLHEFRP